jgi:Cu-Zn family superoxide dismutase
MKNKAAACGAVSFVGIVAIGLVVLVAAATGAGAGANVVRASGPLVRYADPYGTGAANPIEEGATATVRATEDASGKTLVSVQVRGLPADREFGAHVHVGACNNNKAGGHYQHVPAPTGGNTSAYANPDNEIWLDFTTNAAGNASAQASVDWTFRTDGANALMIHDHATTATDPGAGTAGAKLACLDVDF